jgi:hypothetical protein
MRPGYDCVIEHTVCWQLEERWPLMHDEQAHFTPSMMGWPVNEPQSCCECRSHYHLEVRVVGAVQEEGF